MHRLPPIILLTGLTLLERRSLARALASFTEEGITTVELDAPVYGAIRGAFFHGNPYTLVHPDQRLPELNSIPIGTWMEKFRELLAPVLPSLLAKTVRQELDSWASVVIVGAGETEPKDFSPPTSTNSVVVPDGGEVLCDYLRNEFGPENVMSVELLNEDSSVRLLGGTGTLSVSLDRDPRETAQRIIDFFPRLSAKEEA